MRKLRSGSIHKKRRGKRRLQPAVIFNLKEQPGVVFHCIQRHMPTGRESSEDKGTTEQWKKRLDLRKIKQTRERENRELKKNLINLK